MPLEWLSNQDYNLALQARAHHHVPNLLDPDKVRQLYLNDFLLLEHDLRTFNCIPLPFPKQIVGIDTIQNYQSFKAEQPVIIEILGMPRAGKDTIKELILNANPKTLFFGEEPYSQAQQYSRHFNNSSFNEVLTAISMAELIAPLLNAKRSMHEPDTVIFLNRGLTNNPIFSRARFLFGETPPQEYNQAGSIPHNWQRALSVNMDALVFFFIDPQESIKRISSGSKHSPHKSFEFLQLLYQLNLIAYYNLVTAGTPNVIALDMTGDIKTNFIKFNTVMYELLGKRYSVS